MNEFPLNTGNTRLWKWLMKGRDDLSWAGASANDRGFCFGTEDGTVLWTNYDGVQFGHPLPNATRYDDEEAVNGIAFNAGRMVVTTRGGSAIWKNLGSKMKERDAGRIGVGSHGVVAGRNETFLMPLNIGGLMSVQNVSPTQFSTFTNWSEPVDLNMYRVASLSATDGRQVVGIAARRGGVAMGFYKPGNMLNLTGLELPTADFIDICSAGNSNFPSAAYALTRDGHILAFDDVMNGMKPVTLRYESMSGVAYRILSVGDFVFVLTSKALHVIHNLVDYAPGSFRVNRRTKNTSFPLEAIDMNLVGQRWLLVLLPDRVLRLDLHELAKDLASGFEEIVSEPTDIWANATFTERKLDAHKLDFTIAK